MIGAEYSPGRFDRLMRRIPEGAVLRFVFFGLLGMASGVVGTDLWQMSLAERDVARTVRREPLPMERPAPGDQIRPYLPRTIPVGPDRGEPTLPGYDGPVDGEAMALPMRFVAGPGGALTAIGRIDIGTAASFKAALEDSAVAVRSLHLHSPGGSVEDAMAMARLVRERRIDTHVPANAYCASACPLLFAGGDERRVGEGAWVGLHQVYAVAIEGVPRMRDIDASISDIQATIAECQQLLVDMGVAPEIWIKAMKTPPDALYVLTEEDLRTSGLVTAERFGPPMPARLVPPAVEDRGAASPVEASAAR